MRHLVEVAATLRNVRCVRAAECGERASKPICFAGNAQLLLILREVSQYLSPIALSARNAISETHLKWIYVDLAKKFNHTPPK